MQKSGWRLPAVSSHDFHDKCSLVRVSSADDGIDGFDDAVECRVGSDGHVGSTEVVIDRADHTGDVEALVLRALFAGDS